MRYLDVRPGRSDIYRNNMVRGPIRYIIRHRARPYLGAPGNLGIRSPVRPSACSPFRLFARPPVRPSACSPVRPSIDRRPATHQRAAITWRTLVVLNCYRYRLFVSVCVFLRSTRQLGESVSVLHVIVCIGFCSFAAICYFLYITLLEL